MWMSMRSSMGPEMRFWYLVTVECEQVYVFVHHRRIRKGRATHKNALFFTLYQGRLSSLESALLKLSLWENDRVRQFIPIHNHSPGLLSSYAWQFRIQSVSLLPHHQLWTILQRLCQVYRQYLLAPCQIRDCARQLGQVYTQKDKSFAFNQGEEDRCEGLYWNKHQVT